MAQILLAEDEDTVREFVSRVLVMHGHSVIEARDGAKAVELMNQHHFDLLLTDIVMPIMDGISLALKVRATKPDVPIILMTGYANESQRAHNLSVLIEELLTKPFNKDELVAAVNKALGIAGKTIPGVEVSPSNPAS